jgi:hypothetical protein
MVCLILPAAVRGEEADAATDPGSGPVEEVVQLADEFRIATARVVQQGERPRIGEQVVYLLQATLPPGWELTFPRDPDMVPGLRAIRDQISVRKKATDQGTTFEVSIPFLVLRSGHIRVPSILFPVKHRTGASDHVTAGSLVVSTGSWLEGTAEPAPGSVIPPVPLVERNWLAWAAALALGALLLGALVTLWILHVRGRRVIAVPVPRRPAHETALERLDELASGEALASGNFEALYTALSECLRQYLGGRYGFDSLDMTTTELHHRLSRADLRPADFDEVQALLQEFDLVKFARKIPPLGQAETDVSNTREFVIRTMETVTVGRPS